MPKRILRERDPKTLSNHPVSIRIYGDAVDKEWVARVAENGIQDAIMGLPDGTIISGHRRMQAARILKLKSVPYIERPDLVGDELGQIEAIIAANDQRVKTNEQLAREASERMRIAKIRSSQRQKTGKKQAETDLRANLPRGRARDEVADQMGISGRTVEDLTKAQAAIDMAEANGETEAADEIREALDKSPNAAAKLIKEQKKPPVELSSYAKKWMELRDFAIAADAAWVACCTKLHAARNIAPTDEKPKWKKAEDGIKPLFKFLEPYRKIALCAECEGAGCGKCKRRGIA